MFTNLSVKISLTEEQLRRQYGAACRAAQGIVRKPHKFVVEDGVLAQSAERYAHAAVQIAVQTRLRTVVLVEIRDELLRRMRQT